MAAEDAEDIMELFSRPTREWFGNHHGAPTPVQLDAWRSIVSGRHTLVVAPTGSGKTLSAFLWALDRLHVEPDGAGTRVLYISPLKALGVDIERNLRAPLSGISQIAERHSNHSTWPSVGIRSGDTTASQRRKLLINPPDILITTPESLYLMLTSRAAATLAGVETVILDEVHAVAGGKRGAHLAVSLERLDALTRRCAQRIGLSATVEPVAEVARFLGGIQPVNVVRPPTTKVWELQIREIPRQTESVGTSESEPAAKEPVDTGVWTGIAQQSLELILANRTTLIFANSRRAAERLSARINELHQEHLGHRIELSHSPAAEITSADSHGAPAELARAHHGSVSKEQRAEIEEALKDGRLRCVVATSSLELGIDMGSIDLVVQVETPPGVASALQRIGRAGHQVGAPSRGVLLPKHPLDLVSLATTVQQMRSGSIEPIAVPRNPLDIIAQHTVAAAAVATLDVEDWYKTLRRAAPFADLPWSAYESVLDLLSGHYPSTEFAELRPRVVWDREQSTITSRPGAKRVAVTNSGTIPDRGLFGVFLPGEGTGRRVGELDEQMVHESKVGDVIVLGATSWRIERITHDRVLVSPAFGRPGRLPFWIGEGIGRPFEFGRAIGAMYRELTSGSDPGAHLLELGMTPNAAQQVKDFLDEQLACAGTVPSDTRLVLERCTDELGDWRIMLHSPFGLPVHAPWSAAIAHRIRSRYGIDGQVVATDDGIIARIPATDAGPPDAELFVFDPDELDELITSEVTSSSLFAARFRECAGRALLLPRTDPRRRAPLWQQRLKAGQLLDVAKRYPRFPIMIEAIRECLQDTYDLPALTHMINQIRTGVIQLVEVTTPAPSPFARSLMRSYTSQYMYDEDSPSAERLANALGVDLDLLGELLGRANLREVLDAEVIVQVEADLQRLSQNRKMSGVEGAIDLLRILGPLTRSELLARVNGDLDWNELLDSSRVAEVSIAGEEHLVEIADLFRLREGPGPGPVWETQDSTHRELADPMADLVGRFAATHGPFTTGEVAASFGFTIAEVEQVLNRLVGSGRLAKGGFNPATTGSEWCDVKVLNRIKKRSLSVLRAQVQPVPPARLGTFLPAWQQIGAKLRGLDGLAAVLEQLAGVSAPASAWESLILPTRVLDFTPAMLDQLLGSGEIIFCGQSKISDNDGWISFHVASDVHNTLANQQIEVTTKGQELLNQLKHGGHFLKDLTTETGEAHLADLMDLFWAGLVTNDSFAVIRTMLNTSSTHRTATRTPRIHTYRSTRVRVHQLLSPGGRWSLIQKNPTELTAMMHAKVEYLLDRHGIITRGGVLMEGFPGGFEGAYRVLCQMEERGLVRRGYFVSGLGGAQFGLASTVDQLRSPGVHDGPVALTLAATDPANPYGAALEWPRVEGHRPGRRAGALVVLVDGELVLYLERGGRTILAFSQSQKILTDAASSLVTTLQMAGVPKLSVELVNQEPIVGSALGNALIQAGFYLSHRSIRFRN